MKLKIVLLAIAAIAIAAPAPAQEGIANQTVPVSFVLPPTPCTPNPIAFSGNVHFFANITTNKNSMHLKGHINAQGISGTELVDPPAEGAKYKLNGAANVEMSLSGVPVPFSVEATVNANLEGQGRASDAVAHLVFRLAVNAEGEPTLEFTKIRAECKGIQ